MDVKARNDWLNVKGAEGSGGKWELAKSENRENYFHQLDVCKQKKNLETFRSQFRFVLFLNFNYFLFIKHRQIEASREMKTKSGIEGTETSRWLEGIMEHSACGT